jgi:hypothetical protein
VKTLWETNLPDETKTNNQTKDGKEEKQLRLQTIKRDSNGMDYSTYL